VAHPSDFAVQREAETMIVPRFGADLELAFVPGGRIQVGDGAYVQVDDQCEAGRRDRRGLRCQ
jgi:hypothetical protein